MGVVERGHGRPTTLFAPGGRGEHLERRMRYADGVPGTTVGFVYGESGRCEGSAVLRREADRDADEARAVALAVGATQAVGFSRGARALVGVLAEDPTLLERVALVMPPGGRAAGRYADWLGSPTGDGPTRPTADVLVVGHRGDGGHPARVAQVWAERVGARLEILPARGVLADPGRVARLLADFLT